MLVSVLRQACQNQIRRNFIRCTAVTRSFVSVHNKKENKPFVYIKNEQEKEEFERLLPVNDPNTFGSISTSVEEIEGDEGDREEEEFLSNKPPQWQKLGMRQYADMIKEHLNNRKVFEAIEVLEHRMLKVDRVKPTNYIYNLLIDGCARAGYTPKAFALYTRMKQRQLKVTGSTYTSLFNACANSPFIKDALDRANRLREVMYEKGYIPNVNNYNAMIKAYGRLGDITTAFHLVDEMQTAKLPVRVETFNFLLQACVSDKELGFRHALLVWHKMHRRCMAPDLYSFNLLLRTTRDCGLGDVEATQQVIDELMAEAEKRTQIAAGKKQKQISDGNESTEEEAGMLTIVDKPPSQQVQERTNLNLPNLLAPIPKLGSLISISEVTKPEDRLLLLGGFTGFINEMKRSNVEPDIKSCTLLLEILPSNLEAEKRLLSYIKDYKIRCDIDFFNILIKKRAMRRDMEAAQNVLKMIKTANLQPDIVTYGVFALGCRTEIEARTLIAQMQKEGITLNIEILGAMFRQGCCTVNFDYVEEILAIIRNSNIQPSELFIKNLYKFRSYLSYLTKKGPDKPSGGKEEHKERERIKKFRARLDDWMQYYGIRGLPLEEAVKKFKTHPYRQFKEAAPDGVEPEKNSRKKDWKKKRGKLAIVG